MRRKSLFRAMRPGRVPLRELVDRGERLTDSVEPLRLAFSELQLDPESPTDWQVLAAILAIHSIRSLPGRPGWTEVDHLSLLSHVHRLNSESATLRLNDAKVCEKLARDKKSPNIFRAGHGKGEGLQKQLRKAREQFRDSPLIRSAYPLAFRD